jgi:hypothetical protein
MEGPVESRFRSPGLPEYRDDPTLPEGTKKQIEAPKEGLDVTVTRVISQDGELLEQENFVSRYRPKRAVYLLGTKKTE